MGWFGYEIYDGDETQTRHIDFLKWAKVIRNDNEASILLDISGTFLSDEEVKTLKKNTKLILLKMPKSIKDENDAIAWQMLLCLFIDNDIKPLKIILNNGIKSTKFLMGEHANEFDNPKERKRFLKNFLKKVNKWIKTF